MFSVAGHSHIWRWSDVASRGSKGKSRLFCFLSFMTPLPAP